MADMKKVYDDLIIINLYGALWSSVQKNDVAKLVINYVMGLCLFYLL